MTAGRRLGVARGEDAPVQRCEVRGEQHLRADLLFDLGRVAMVEQSVGVKSSSTVAEQRGVLETAARAVTPVMVSTMMPLRLDHAGRRPAGRTPASRR